MKTLFLILILAVAISAQTVEVTQGFVDDATKSFRENVALRAALEASQSAAKAWEVAAMAKDAEAKSKDTLISIITKQRDEALAMKCQKDSWFFGLKKSTRCY